MMKQLFILFILSVASLGVVHADDNIMFEKANQLYRNKMYDSAANLYQQLLDDGYTSANLYYNAGNAYYKSQRIGMSIWCYKKALQLKRNKNIKDNLELAKMKISNPVPEIPQLFIIKWWQGLLNLLSINGWSIVAILAFLLGICIMFYQKLKGTPLSLKLVKNLLFTVSIAALIFLSVKTYFAQFTFKGIIIKKSASFVNAQTNKSEPIGEGNEVQVLSKGIQLSKVKLSDGRIGQMETSAFKRL